MTRISLVLSALVLCALWAWTKPAVGEIPVSGPPQLPEDTPLIERPWTADPAKFQFAVFGDKDTCIQPFHPALYSQEGNKYLGIQQGN